MNEEHAKDIDDLFLDRLGSFLAHKTTLSTKKLLIDEFNNTDSPYKDILENYILPLAENLSLSDFTPTTVDHLVKELEINPDERKWRGPIIASVATEELVVERLLPLYKCSEEPTKSYLKSLLQDIGKRHQRRYIL